MTLFRSTAEFFNSLAVRSDGTAYSLANNGTSLLKYDVETPYKSTAITLSGNNSALSALDFRPATGELYGYSDATNTYVKVDTLSGKVTSASGTGVTATDTSLLDIDWNPMIDRLRTVTETDQNIVYNPVTGQASDASTVDLFYAANDVQQGKNPAIVANAYTNNVAGATTTQQYALDHASNTLVTLANNAGTLNTIGILTLDDKPLDFGPMAGFDIITDAKGKNTAYATLVTQGDVALYTINLSTAEASLVGVVDNEGVNAGSEGGLFSSLGLDDRFGISAGSDYAISLGLIA